MSNFKYQKGFTLSELLIVMGVMLILLGFISVNLISVQKQASINAAVLTIVSDIKQQQQKAMLGESVGGSGGSYGVHFDTNQYLLFQGITYNVLDPNNLPISLEENMQFSTAGIDIVFGQITGEIPAGLTVGLLDTTNGQQKTIQVNRYGAVTQVN